MMCYVNIGVTVYTDAFICKIPALRNKFQCSQYLQKYKLGYNMNFMFEFLCIISLYYIKNQQDATLAVLFISNCKITLHVLDAFCVHHQEY